jgi:NitT/TauT family transport system substrate-binding protein
MRHVVTLAALIAALAGCGQTGPTVPPAGQTEPSDATQAALATNSPPEGTTGAPIPVTIGLPFRPDVQFTPFYVAQASGFFADQGLEVTFEYGDESTFVRRVAAHDIIATIASGEQVILAATQDIPVRYVMTWYERFPIAVFSTSLALESPRDLVGHTVGLPDQAGASYLGWQALLASEGIDPSTITTEVVGYDQVNAVSEGRVDAAVGYVANEPVQLRARGLEPGVIHVADYFNFAANGLVVAEDTLRDSPELVEAMVRALQAAIYATIEDPDAAFEAALKTVPEAADPTVRDTQRAVLEASIPLWIGDTRPANAAAVGAIDTQVWAASRQFLLDAGIVSRDPPPVDQLIDARFVSAPSP